MSRDANKMSVKIKQSEGVCSYGYNAGDLVAVIIQDPKGYIEGMYDIEKYTFAGSRGGGSLIKRTELEHTDLVFIGDICPSVFGDIYRHAFCMLLGGKVPWVYRYGKEGTRTEVPCSDHDNQVIFELEVIERVKQSVEDYAKEQRRIAEKTIGSYENE